jgi:hypothetical protein
MILQLVRAHLVFRTCETSGPPKIIAIFATLTLADRSLGLQQIGPVAAVCRASQVVHDAHVMPPPKSSNQITPKSAAASGNLDPQDAQDGQELSPRESPESPGLSTTNEDIAIGMGTVPHIHVGLPTASISHTNMETIVATPETTDTRRDGASLIVRVMNHLSHPLDALQHNPLMLLRGRTHTALHALKCCAGA